MEGVLMKVRTRKKPREKGRGPKPKLTSLKAVTKRHAQSQNASKSMPTTTFSSDVSPVDSTLALMPSLTNFHIYTYLFPSFITDHIICDMYKYSLQITKIFNL